MSLKSRNADKRGQYWTSIRNQKLDSLRWVMLHSGLNVAGLEDDDGKTGLMIAAGEGKAKSILVMLDILRQKRELKEAIDRPDETGRTPLMLAAAKGFVEVVDHLVYYGADTKKKDGKGQTARDHAAANRCKPVTDYFDELEAEAAAVASGASAVEAGNGLDEDGLTSTQRSKLKKKQLKDQERQAMMAAVHAAAAAKGDEMPDDLLEEEGDGAGSGAAVSSTGSLGKLPSPPPAARWADLVTVIGEKRREYKQDWTSKPASSPAEEAERAPGPDGSLIDPLLWHVGLLNRLELRLGPHLTTLPTHIGHLNVLQTLILAHNGLTELPDTLGLLTELKFLDVSRNALAALPPAPVMSKLAKLEVLDCSLNKLTSLDSLSGLTGLTSLLAGSNAVKEVGPATLAWSKLARLDVLSLCHNGLTALPEEIGQLQALSVLDAGDNALEELPAGLADLNVKKLKDLALLPNPIADKKVCACADWTVRTATPLLHPLTAALSLQVLKALNKDDKKEGIKELFKVLQSSGTGKGKGGGKKK